MENFTIPKNGSFWHGSQTLIIGNLPLVSQASLKPSPGLKCKSELFQLSCSTN